MNRLRIHAPTGRLERELLLSDWESAISRAIAPGMLPEEVATVACAVTVELMQGRVYFGRVHRNLFRDRAIACLARTGNSEELGQQFNLCPQQVRKIIRARRAGGAS